jgi:hypothetical protein
MHQTVKIVTLSMLLLLPALSSGQECSDLSSGTAADAAEYLRHAQGQPSSPACLQSAFHTIARLPVEQAVPLLTQNLGLKRSLTSAERHGIFMHGNTTETLYPAVYSLFTIGPPAKPGLISFIGRSEEGKVIERKNALYTLLLIEHGNAMHVIESLMKASRQTRDASGRTRLRAAAENAAKWCDDRIRGKCREALQ